MIDDLGRLAYGETDTTRVPEGTEVVAKWGARLIVHDQGRGLDLVPDRQDAKALNPEEREALGNAISRLLAQVRLQAQRKPFRSNQHDRREFDNGRAHAICDTRASYGYLYMIVYLTPEEP